VKEPRREKLFGVWGWGFVVWCLKGSISSKGYLKKKSISVIGRLF
jgi:hypothetical protein